MANLSPVLSNAFSSIPHTQLTVATPAPIQALPTLSRIICPSSCTQIFIAREDLNSSLAYGGNKTRKLEYIIPQALQFGADTLVTEGGFQSSHTRQVAAVAAQMGLKCVVILSPWMDDDPSPTEESINAYADSLMGAEVRYVPKVEAGQAPAELIAQLRRNGRNIHWIPTGGSKHEYGGVGYARWMFELLRNREPEMRASGELGGTGIFETVFVVCVSGSTLGGMIAGAKLYEQWRYSRGLKAQRRRLVGIDASGTSKHEQKQSVLEIARRTARLIGLDEEDVTETDVNVDVRWNCGAYGRCDKLTSEAMADLSALEGVLTDPIYTGKGIAGVMQAVKRGEVKGNVLFIHTGGRLALHAWTGNGGQSLA